MTAIEHSFPAASQGPSTVECRSRQAERSALLLVVGLTLAACHTFTGQDPSSTGAAPAEVRASGFVLLGSDGRTRARLALDENDSPQLLLMDKAGTVRIKLAIDRDAEVLGVFADSKGQTRIGFAVDAAEQPHFLLMDEGQKPRLHLAVSGQGAPSLMCIHADGSMSAGLGIHADGRSWLRNDTAGAGTDRAKDGEGAAKEGR